MTATVSDDREFPRFAFNNGIAMQSREIDLDTDETDTTPIPFTGRPVEGEQRLDAVFDTDLDRDNDREVVLLSVTDTRTDETVLERELPFERLGFEPKPGPPDPSTIRNDIERDIIDATDGKTLYRVGQPRISDVWLRSFSAGRGSGGLGAGVYGYVTEAGARQDSSAVANPDRRDRIPQPVIALKGALKNPLIISGDGTDKVRDLNYVSQFMSALGADARRNEGAAIEAYRDGLDPNLTPDALAADLVIDNLDRAAFRMWLLTTGQREGTFLPDEPEGWQDRILDACEDAAKQSGDRDQLRQPISFLLDPFDGIYPTAGAGGNSNRYGAVVFKRKVDRCVGRTTSMDENLDPEVLNDCFASERR